MAPGSELDPHARKRKLVSIGLAFVGVESVVLLDPDQVGAFESPARLSEANA
ncbi:hypothetical protein [Amaricoccus solimangrovi]|uniref:hypothetical protein n=1 Tax=Amaricoccus solimangrovi TaxID=2589815 RepID=UPI0015E45324|nr:hypothetical protein [Amaricoccus solimangrovi]